MIVVTENNLAGQKERPFLKQFQFTIPVLFCVLPFFLIVGLPATGINFGQAGNVMGFVVSAFPVIDPICMILAYSRRVIIIIYLQSVHVPYLLIRYRIKNTIDLIR